MIENKDIKTWPGWKVLHELLFITGERAVKRFNGVSLSNEEEERKFNLEQEAYRRIENISIECPEFHFRYCYHCKKPIHGSYSSFRDEEGTTFYYHHNCFTPENYELYHLRDKRDL